MRGYTQGLSIALTLVSGGGFLSLGGGVARAQAVPAVASTRESAQWQEQLEGWRRQREKEISAPDGWLTLEGLEWLKTGFNSVGSSAESQIRMPAQGPDTWGF